EPLMLPSCPTRRSSDLLDQRQAANGKSVSPPAAANNATAMGEYRPSRAAGSATAAALENRARRCAAEAVESEAARGANRVGSARSEEHTSELQSRENLV